MKTLLILEMAILCCRISEIWNADGRCRPHAVDTLYEYGDATGASSVVYVIDTGIRISHVDFEGRAIAGYSARCPTGQESDCVTQGGRWAYEGVIEDYGACSDDHGTHCAGTVASATYGVAKEATVVAVQGLSCDGTGTSSTVIEALEWCMQHAASHGFIGAIFSMSLGGSASYSEDRTVAAAHAANFSVIAAAGNEADDACKSSPGREPTAITVGRPDSSSSSPSVPERPSASPLIPTHPRSSPLIFLFSFSRDYRSRRPTSPTRSRRDSPTMGIASTSLPPG